MTPTPPIRAVISAAALALKQRKDEVNRLNVFPVPDGDTGTNMSLTMDALIAEVGKLADDAGMVDICHAVTQGSLMGARGNSGVILSQILRGLCSVVAEAERVDAALVADALARAQSVAYQAVRKPVEGTMLTVVKDAASAAKAAVEAGSDLEGVLHAVVAEAYASVARGPELLDVLKQAGVVDAGGFGLAILAEGFTAAMSGQEMAGIDLTFTQAAPILGEPANDWNDEEYIYCTEFLLLGDGVERADVEQWVSTQGGSQLVVGEDGVLKVHVHTDDPASVLAHATSIGEVAEVHVNNMRRQSAARAERLRATEPPAAAASPKPVGFVAVAAGGGLTRILESLGVDRVVNGGQTMNPSTAELADACNLVSADTVVILPDNRNIVLAAQQAAQLCAKPVDVVPTTSVPEAFSAMLAFDPSAGIEANVAAMTEAAAAVRTGEVTIAIKDSAAKAGAIKAGQVIGIFDHEIEIVGEDVADVATRLLDVIADGAETLTVLAGADYTDEQLASLASALAEAHPELEVESHRGDQPLYPVILAVE